MKSCLVTHNRELAERYSDRLLVCTPQGLEDAAPTASLPPASRTR